MLVSKNRHQEEAAATLLGSKGRGKVLIDSLRQRSGDDYCFFTSSEGSLELSVLAVPNKGATVTILAPNPSESWKVPPTTRLIKEAIQWSQGEGIRLAQTVMPVEQVRLKESFLGGGFDELATLNYMERARSSSHIPQNIPDRVRFAPVTEFSDEELGSIMLGTYEGSLDCPKIQGIRKVQDIIDGHRGHAPSDAQLWYIAEVEHRQVGVVLLNYVSQAKCMELAYLGVTPWARGRGLGDACMQFVVDVTAEHGVKRISLAVDENNSPAIQLYNRWKFKMNRQRYAMICKLY